MKHTGSKRAKIIATKLKHPEFDPAQIARCVGTSTNYVLMVLTETGCIESISNLGRAARAAGLTVKMIQAMASKSEAA